MFVLHAKKNMREENDMTLFNILVRHKHIKSWKDMLMLKHVTALTFYLKYISPQFTWKEMQNKV